MYCMHIVHYFLQIKQSDIDSGQLCAFTVSLACEVSGCSPLTLEVEIIGVKPPNNTFTIKRNSFVFNSSVTTDPIKIST